MTDIFDICVEVNAALETPTPTARSVDTVLHVGSITDGMSLPEQLRALAGVIESHPHAASITDVHVRKKDGGMRRGGISFNYLSGKPRVSVPTMLQEMGIEQLPDIVVTIGGRTHSGKTTVAAMIRQMLAENGTQCVDSLNTDGDQAFIQRHLPEQAAVLTTKNVLIIDSNPYGLDDDIGRCYAVHTRGGKVNLEQQLFTPAEGDEQHGVIVLTTDPK